MSDLSAILTELPLQAVAFISKSSAGFVDVAARGKERTDGAQIRAVAG